MHGNVISSEYTFNEYIHNVPREKLKTIQEYLHKAHRILNQCNAIIKIL